jgi:hypothetical protein
VWPAAPLALPAASAFADITDELRLCQLPMATFTHGQYVAELV